MKIVLNVVVLILLITQISAIDIDPLIFLINGTKLKIIYEIKYHPVILTV